MLREYLKSIANVIREKLGTTDKINAQNFANKVDEVYEAGKQKAYDDFWNEFQDYGRRRQYVYAFAYSNWTDKVYNPKYPLITTNYGLRSSYNNSGITDTKVDIDVYKEMSGSFTNSKIVTIRKLILINVTTITNPFGGCTNLKDIAIEGEWLKSISFASSPLTVESMKSIITHLKNYKGTEEEFSYTLTLASNCKTLLNEEGSTAPNGITWKDYIFELGWNLA